MARIRQGLSYSDTRAELVEHKSMTRGASEDAFWDEDELVDHRPKRKYKKKKKKGCPGNEGKAHIYVWVNWDTAWHFGDTEYEIKVCCGCEQRAAGKSFRRKIND